MTMGFPSDSWVRTYSIEAWRAASAIPTACEAMPILPESRALIASLKPLFNPPSICFSETRQFSKKIETVNDESKPSFSSCFPTLKPSKSGSIRKDVIPLCPLAGSVLAKMIITSATLPLVINVFSPLRTYDPSSIRSAVVRMADGSLPAEFSVRAKAPATNSPLANLGRYVPC